MNHRAGKLVVFEGIDGSGKSTQFDMLRTHLAHEGKNFRRISFPRYNEPSSALLKMYLGGEFGKEPNSVNAYAASTFFTVDRIASYLKDWKAFYEDGGLVMTDRYTTSNAIHQGAKIPHNERKRFFDWLYEYEFDFIELPKPDCVIYFDIDAKHAAERIEARQAKTNAAVDIHEADFDYLVQCAKSGLEAAEHYGWKTIHCFDGGHERTVEEVRADVMDIFSTL